MNDSPTSRSGFGFVTQCVSPRERSVRYEAKGADEWEINKRSGTANFPLHQKNVLFLVATILRSSKK